MSRGWTTRRLGRSELQITRIGLGSWAIGGGGWSFGWGPQDDDASLAAMQHAIDRGVNWIDTAAVYGLGHSEELVGRLIRQLPPRLTGAIVGARAPEQVDGWIDAASITLTRRDLDEIEAAIGRTRAGKGPVRAGEAPETRQRV